MSETSATGGSTENEGSNNRGLLAILGTAVVIIGGIIGIADASYEHGKKIGADEQNAACDTRTSTLQASLDKNSVTASADAATIIEAEKHISEWRDAYNADQQTILSQGKQINDLMALVKQNDTCAFLQQQVRNLDDTLDNGYGSRSPREELVARRDSFIGAMAKCTQTQGNAQ
ncbi:MULTISPECIES: hypothetical protein [Paraburkholderia]|uniref:hypothetical protein n=1 Tax=Paraburkholderia TaxID=1822464 RepID=UPI0038B8B287